MLTRKYAHKSRSKLVSFPIVNPQKQFNQMLFVLPSNERDKLFRENIAYLSSRSAQQQYTYIYMYMCVCQHLSVSLSVSCGDKCVKQLAVAKVVLRWKVIHVYVCVVIANMCFLTLWQLSIHILYILYIKIKYIVHIYTSNKNQAIGSYKQS